MLDLRYYQKEAVDSFFDYTLYNHNKNPVIVLPGGTGKSLVIAEIFKKILEYPKTRVLLLTHNKKLIEQDHDEFINHFHDESFKDVGIYCAGMKKKNMENRVIFASIQSIYKKAWFFMPFDVILVDEVHRVPHKNVGMFRQFFTECKQVNKKIIIGGLSATPWRTKGGLLWEGEDKLFDNMIYNYTINQAIKDGYLAPLISKNSLNSADLTEVKVSGGDYVASYMEKAFEKNNLVQKAVSEIKLFTENRKKIIIFTSGIKHCEHVKEEMIKQGMICNSYHSDKNNEENAKILKNFENDTIKYLINVNSLCEGYNEKKIDCVVLLRGTKSSSLFVQMAVRGSRIHPDKTDCLILDFGHNVSVHGSIDKIEIKKAKDGKNEITTCPMKECPKCGSLLYLSQMECKDCGYEFPQSDKHDETASNADIISKWKKPQEYEVLDIVYSRHTKRGGLDSMRVDYYLNQFDKFSEWICIEHTGYAKRKADNWIRQRTNIDINTIEEALDNSQKFLTPDKIIVDENGKYATITGYIFNEVKKDEELNKIPWKNTNYNTNDELDRHLERLL